MRLGNLYHLIKTKGIYCIVSSMVVLFKNINCTTKVVKVIQCGL